MAKLDAKRVPCTIVTGFLGAGKTTIVRHVLENGYGRRLAVIVNEFGDVGVDGDLLRRPVTGGTLAATPADQTEAPTCDDPGCGDRASDDRGCGDPLCDDADIVELANGCLCCTVADDFVPALDQILSREPKVDHILIETSGLALPKPLVQAFQWPSVKSRVTVDAVIAVVDGLALAEGRVATDIEALEAQRKGDTSIDHESPIDEVFVDQIACADMVLLTKTDLLNETGLASAEGRIRPHLAASVRIVPLANGQIDPGVLLGLERAVENDIENRVTLHDGLLDHEHDDFESFVVDVPVVHDTDDLGRRVARLFAEAGALRVKGYVEVSGKPLRYLVQSVGPRVSSHYDRAWETNEPRRSCLVVIGEKGLDPNKVRDILAAA